MKKRNRPDVMHSVDETGKVELKGSSQASIIMEYRLHVRELYLWANHLEQRLAKYETHDPDPGANEVVVVKLTEFDPDARPVKMVNLDTASLNEVPLSLEYYASKYTRSGACETVVDLYNWAKHLEEVRVGLQRQLNAYEDIDIRLQASIHAEAKAAKEKPASE